MASLNYSACIVSNWHTVFFRNSKVRLRLCDGVQAEPECRQGDASDNGQALCRQLSGRSPAGVPHRRELCRGDQEH